MAPECHVVNWNMTARYSPVISLKTKAETKHLVVPDNQIYEWVLSITSKPV